METTLGNVTPASMFSEWHRKLAEPDSGQKVIRRLRWLAIEHG
jgi:hypothetical protein